MMIVRRKVATAALALALSVMGACSAPSDEPGSPASSGGAAGTAQPASTSAAERNLCSSAEFLQFVVQRFSGASFARSAKPAPNGCDIEHEPGDEAKSVLVIVERRPAPDGQVCQKAQELEGWKKAGGFESVNAEVLADPGNNDGRISYGACYKQFVVGVTVVALSRDNYWHGKIQKPAVEIMKEVIRRT